MGFINPGKPLKRKKKGATPSPKKKAKNAIAVKKKPVSFSELPIEIIYTIFILSKPNNNLPLVNKEFNNLLKFDPYHQDQSVNWRNLSLVLEMVRTWYVVDLNTRIDFNLINKKLDYYRNRLFLVQHEQIYHENDESPSIETNANYKMIIKNIKIIQHTIHRFQLNSHCKGISDKILSNRFVSRNLIENYFKPFVFSSKYDESNQEYLNIVSEGEIVFERKTRLRFLRYKFKELSIYFQFLISQINNDSSELPMLNSTELDPTTTIPEIKDIESTEEVIMDENEKLPEYDDERQRIEPWLLNGSTNLSLPFIFEENTAIYDFDKTRYRRNFPTIIYRNGINNYNKFELLQFLHNTYEFNFEDIDEILNSTFHNFKPNLIDKIDSQSLSLDLIVSFVVSSKQSQISQSPVINLLQLYHEYEPNDWSEFGTNYKGDLISEDISKALIQLLTAFYEQTEIEDRDIWKFVLESKNFNLAQLLMRFSECPSFELL